jgi:hypothetical protein
MIGFHQSGRLVERLVVPAAAERDRTVRESELAAEGAVLEGGEEGVEFGQRSPDKTF